MAQIPDMIIFNGKEYLLHNNPLEIYFEENPEKRPKVEIWSNALYKGYMATFEIKTDQLYLKDIEILSANKRKRWFLNDLRSLSEVDMWKSVQKKVFPKQKEVKIDWMTGLLVLPSGKLIEYVDTGYDSTFEYYTILEINGGNLVNELHFENHEFEKFKEKQFQEFNKTDEYQKLKTGLQNNTAWSDNEIESFIKSRILEYLSTILVE